MRGEVIAMDGYILRNRQEQLTLPADAGDKLLQSGQGDAALLYLALRPALERAGLLPKGETN